MTTVGKRLKHAWNVFNNTDTPYRGYSQDLGANYAYRPDRVRLHVSHERSIISSIVTRISIDAASIDMRHVRLDDDGRFKEYIKSGLDYCLTTEANLDQGARAFMQDTVLTMLDEGTVSITPIDTTINPELGSFDIKTMRTGKVVQWYPKKVTLSVYNENTGMREDVTVFKNTVAIAHNPMAPVMNETNSTLQRLIRKLNLLDRVDEASSSGKLDLIIQLPYVVKSDEKRRQARQRAQDIQDQLKQNDYGVAYTDGTEKVVQLNRPVENNLWKQIQDLRAQVLGELGLTVEIMNGTADEKAMLYYQNRTIEPILGVIAEAMKRAFLTKTAMSQGQSIEYYRDPFKLVPMEQLAEIADKFTRNEIVTANEFRSFIGLKPSADPKADELRNSNIAQPLPEAAVEEEVPEEDDGEFDQSLTRMESSLNDILGDLGEDSNAGT